MSFRSRLPEHIPPAAWVIIGVVLLWRLPDLVLFHAGLFAGRVRLGVELATVETLDRLGRRQAARDLMASVVRRARRQERAAERAMLERGR